MICPFCEPEKNRILFEEGDFFALWDKYPVAEGHALIIPKRHVSTFFDLNKSERLALIDVIEKVKIIIENKYRPDGFNIGFNVGRAAGQSIDHMHIHVIPRRYGDMKKPKGGIRHVIPEKGNY